MTELWPGSRIYELPQRITFDGVSYEIPDTPSTAELLSWLAHGAWAQVFPGLLAPMHTQALLERVCDKHDPLNYRHLFPPAATVLGRLAGMQNGPYNGYWPAHRVVSTALARWPQYAAWCATRGANMLSGPLWQATALAYGFVREMMAERLDVLEAQVWAAPPGRRTGLPAAPDPEEFAAEERRLAAEALAAIEAGGGDEFDG